MIAAMAAGAVVYLVALAAVMDPPEVRGRHRRARHRAWGGW